jgi:hypothetical protein
MSDDELKLHLESLHAKIAKLTESTQQWVEFTKRLGARERKARAALLNGVEAYLRTLSSDDEEDEKK